MRKGCFFPKSSLNGQLNLLGISKGRAIEEAGYCDVDLVQPGIFCLYDVLRSLETGGDWLVPKDDVGGP